MNDCSCSLVVLRNKMRKFAFFYSRYLVISLYMKRSLFILDFYHGHIMKLKYPAITSTGIHGLNSYTVELMAFVQTHADDFMPNT